MDKIVGRAQPDAFLYEYTGKARRPPRLGCSAHATMGSRESILAADPAPPVFLACANIARGRPSLPAVACGMLEYPTTANLGAARQPDLCLARDPAGRYAKGKRLYPQDPRQAAPAGLPASRHSKARRYHPVARGSDCPRGSEGMPDGCRCDLLPQTPADRRAGEDQLRHSGRRVCGHQLRRRRVRAGAGGADGCPKPGGIEPDERRCDPADAIGGDRCTTTVAGSAGYPDTAGLR